MLNTLWINVAFIVGGATDGGYWGDLYWALIYDAVFFGLNAIIYWTTLPGMCKYYRWREQEWWPFGDMMDEDEDTNSM